MKTIKTLKKKVESKNKCNNKGLLNKLFLLLTPILFLAFSANAQMSLNDVEFAMIEEETVQEYLYKQIDNNVETFTELKPSLEPTSSIDGFSFHEREYVIKDSIENVWSHYVYTNPSTAWKAGKFDFGFMYSKKANEMIYPDQEVEKVEPGQVVYLNLKLLKIKNIATAFEITTVDKEKGIMEFSYLDDNVTHGKQQLNFEQTADGHTKIVHRSYFKSKSDFRDRFLYPYFHTRLTNTYHRNMKKLYREM